MRKPRTRLGFKLKRKSLDSMYHPIIKKDGEPFGEEIVTEVKKDSVVTKEISTKGTSNPVEEARKIIKETPEEELETVLVSKRYTNIFTKKPKRVITGDEKFTNTPTYIYED